MMSRKKKLILIYGVLVLMLLGTAGWYIWQTLDAPASRPAAPSAKKGKAAPPVADASSKTGLNPVDKSDALKPVPKTPSGVAVAARPESGKDVSVSPLPAIAETGNVDGLSNLHVQIEEYKLLVQIEELKAKLAELKKAQSVSAAPAPPVLSLPALTPPQPQSPAPSAEQLPPPRRKGPVVLSVHGVDENLVAAVRLEGGKRITLRKGEKFGGGVVSEVSRSAGVVVRNGKKTTVLPFE
ncbi:MAG: type IV pilus biogenesis protein PilP [Desulfovibrio sp.]|jgi:type IV pilus biogenesis protein PilP|nr:type IV pilus biogenesis protein PilP [Desulfovibrio sp.]